MTRLGVSNWFISTVVGKWPSFRKKSWEHLSSSSLRIKRGEVNLSVASLGSSTLLVLRVKVTVAYPRPLRRLRQESRSSRSLSET